ncbi:hypothetical protein [Salinibacter ruber]|uniref:hypothetical protein n=1 Tax=Salinibacter ruber TaxID=146919 RepID=UPI002073B351|nr:hypothetical protein [Salinibacter ruber]
MIDYRLLENVKETLKEFSPYYRVYYNGVIVERYKLVDVLSPRKSVNIRRPHYEGKIVHAIKKCVSISDDVVILGGGVGVSTVHVDRMLSGRGSIHVFEPSDFMIDIHQRTMKINDVKTNIKIEKKVVSYLKKPWGPSDASTIQPEDLPKGDVLICDIEGAESDVLPSLKNYETIIVETHGKLGSPTKLIDELLRDNGYSVRNTGVAEPSMWKENLRDDVMVLIAQKN